MNLESIKKELINDTTEDMFRFQRLIISTSIDDYQEFEAESKKSNMINHGCCAVSSIYLLYSLLNFDMSNFSKIILPFVVILEAYLICNGTFKETEEDYIERRVLKEKNETLKSYLEQFVKTREKYYQSVKNDNIVDLIDCSCDTRILYLKTTLLFLHDIFDDPKIIEANLNLIESSLSAIEVIRKEYKEEIAKKYRKLL